MSDGTRLAQAAASMIGTPFRLYGRDPRRGLDCIGLVAASLDRIGQRPLVPIAYRLRNSNIEPLLDFAELSGLHSVSDEIAAGDVLMTTPGPGQHHLLIVDTKHTAIHAHAGLGRVVRQPIENSLRALAHWRLTSSAKEK